MKRHFKVFLLIAVLSLIVIFSHTISREIIETYNESVSGVSIPPPAQIYYQIASR